MRYLLLIVIRIYWLWPKAGRRQCIFEESCSHYVFGITKRHGMAAGIRALKKRYRTCRGGYYRIDDNRARLVDGSIVAVDRLNKNIW